MAQTDDNDFPQPVRNKDHLPVSGEVQDTAVPHDAPNTDRAVTHTEEILGSKDPENEDQ